VKVLLHRHVYHSLVTVDTIRGLMKPKAVTHRLSASLLTVKRLSSVVALIRPEALWAADYFTSTSRRPN